jgi:peptidoglycan hydrolase CwlO-like protein
MSNDEIVKQMQQIVSTLQQIVQASGELAEWVETLEQQAGEKVGLLTSLQGHLQVLLETYQKQVSAQDATNRTVLEALGSLESRLNALEPADGAASASDNPLREGFLASPD